MTGELLLVPSENLFQAPATTGCRFSIPGTSAVTQGGRSVAPSGHRAENVTEGQVLDLPVAQVK